MTNLELALQYPASKKILAVTMAAGKRFVLWTQDATAWYSPCTDICIAAKENGTDLAAASSLANCKATDGSYWLDTSNDRLYVNPVASSPYDSVIVGTLAFYVSNFGKVLNDNLYKARINSLPDVVISVPEQLGDQGHVGGGTIKLDNGDGYFNDLIGLDWDAGYIEMSLGVDVPATGSVMDWSDYEVVGKWRVEAWDREDGEAILRLKEYKSRSRVKIPQAVFQLGELDEANFTWPNIDLNIVGNRVPIAMGPLLGVVAFCVDTTTGTFRVVGHAISAFTAFRTSEGIEVTPDSTDITKSEFVFADWTDDTKTDYFHVPIEVDIVAPYDNPADQIEEVLTTWAGEPDSALLMPSSGGDDENMGFGTYGSRNEWLLGTDNDGNEVSVYAGALYIDSETEALKICETIAAVAGGLFYSDLQGRYVLRLWEPVASENELTLNEWDIDDVKDTTDAGDPVTSVVVGYAHNYSSDTAQFVSDESDEWLYRRNLPSHEIEQKTLDLSDIKDARNWGSRELAMKGPPRYMLDIYCNQKAFLRQPGDAVRVVYSREGIDDFFDVLGVRNKPGTGEVVLSVSNWRGLAARTALVCDETFNFPDRLGGASAETYSPAWSDAQKKWASENGFYICDDNGFAAPTDEDSYNFSVVGP